jgi:hypothetical protein
VIGQFLKNMTRHVKGPVGIIFDIAGLISPNLPILPEKPITSFDAGSYIKNDAYVSYFIMTSQEKT